MNGESKFVAFPFIFPMSDWGPRLLRYPEKKIELSDSHIYAHTLMIWNSNSIFILIGSSLCMEIVCEENEFNHLNG